MLYKPKRINRVCCIHKHNIKSGSRELFLPEFICKGDGEVRRMEKENPACLRKYLQNIRSSLLLLSSIWRGRRERRKAKGEKGLSATLYYPYVSPWDGVTKHHKCLQFEEGIMDKLWISLKKLELGCISSAKPNTSELQKFAMLSDAISWSGIRKITPALSSAFNSIQIASFKRIHAHFTSISGSNETKMLEEKDQSIFSSTGCP